jgi:hypothetical protein
MLPDMPVEITDYLNVNEKIVELGCIYPESGITSSCL